MSGYWLRREDEHLGELARNGCAVRYMAAAIGRTAADVTARLAHFGYDVRDVDTATRRRVVEMRRSGVSSSAIAQEVGLSYSKVVRLLALRGIALHDAPPPPEPQIDPWDRPRPIHKPAPVAQEWPF